MFRTHTFKNVLAYVVTVNDKPHGQSVTVESFDEKTLMAYGKRLVFTYRSKRPISVGQWVSLSGTSRTDEGKKKDGSYRDNNRTYYSSKPFDGSPRKDWRFFQLSVKEEVRLSTKELEKIVSLFLRRHVSSPSKRTEKAIWELKARLLKVVGDHLLKEVRKNDKSIPLLEVKVS